MQLADGNTNSIIHDNFITGESTGPGIQIGTSATTRHVFDDIEVYNNHLILEGSRVWITANYQDNVVHCPDVYIHHNIFTKVGQYNTNTGYSNAGITLGDFDIQLSRTMFSMMVVMLAINIIPSRQTPANRPSLQPM